MDNKSDRPTITYTKLSELVDQEFTVEKMFQAKWKAWDDLNHRMIVSEKFEKGYRKVYACDTNRGRLDLSSAQVGALLEAVVEDARADLNGRSFHVKSNGQSGKDIRYFFNPVQEHEEVSQEEIPIDW